MIELLILWNVAAARADGNGEDNDFTTGVIVVWAMLQVLIWPVSMFLLLWKRLKMKWVWALGTTNLFTYLGYQLWQDNFYIVVGALFSIAAFSLIAHIVTSDS